MEDFSNVFAKVIQNRMYDGKEEPAKRKIDQRKFISMKKQIALLKGLLLEKVHEINYLKILCNKKVENIRHKQKKQLSLTETYAAKLKSQIASKLSPLIRKKATLDVMVEMRNQLSMLPKKEIQIQN